MYEIVLAADTDEERVRAQVETVIDLPRDPSDIHVTILHNFTDNPRGASVSQVGTVRHANEELEDAGIDVTLRESSGDAAAEIITAAEGVDANVICIAGRKRTPTGKVLFGSVTQAVILGSDRPVLVSGAVSDE